MHNQIFWGYFKIYESHRSLKQQPRYWEWCDKKRKTLKVKMSRKDKSMDNKRRKEKIIKFLANINISAF